MAFELRSDRSRSITNFLDFRLHLRVADHRFDIAKSFVELTIVAAGDRSASLTVSRSATHGTAVGPVVRLFSRCGGGFRLTTRSSSEAAG